MILKRVYFLVGLFAVFWLMDGPAAFDDAGRHYGGLVERYLEVGLSDPEALLEEYLGGVGGEALALSEPAAEGGAGLRGTLTNLLRGGAGSAELPVGLPTGLAEQLDAALGRTDGGGEPAPIRPVTVERHCRAWYESSTGGGRECLAWSGG